MVTTCFSKFLGKEALYCETYIDHYFTGEKWSLGCYAGMIALNTITICGKALREQCGHIHWTGTETSDIWNGYMEGAVRSGERVSNELMQL